MYIVDNIMLFDANIWSLLRVPKLYLLGHYHPLWFTDIGSYVGTSRRIEYVGAKCSLESMK